MVKTVIRPDAKPDIGTTPAVVEDKVNIELLLKTLEYIKAHPQTWKQEAWFWHRSNASGEVIPHLVEIDMEEVNSCGSAMCFAGHAALIEGFPAPPKSNTLPWEREVDGEPYPEAVDSFAAKRLGLPYEVAEELFDSQNTLEVLEAMVQKIVDSNGNVYWADLADIRRDILEPDVTVEDYN